MPNWSMANIKQQENKDCGIACLASIGQHYGLYLPQAQIRNWAQTDLQGTNLLGMIHAAKQMGFNAKALRGERKQLKDLPLPAIAHGIMDQRLSHFVVIEKIRPDFIVVMDPLFGERIRMRWEAFEAFWTGVVLQLQPAENFKTFRTRIPMVARMWTHIQSDWPSLLVSWSVAIVYTLLGLSMSIFIQQISDVIIPLKNMDLLAKGASMMLGILVLQFGCLAFKTRQTLRLGRQIDQELTHSYFHHLMHLPQRFFDTHRIGDLLSRISDAVKIRQFINEVFIELFIQASIVICSYSILFSINPHLAWYMTALIPLYAIIYYFSSRWNKRQERQMMEDSARLENHWVESLGKIKSLKLFGAQQLFVAKGRQLADTLLKMVYDSKSMNHTSEWLVQAIRSLFTLLLLWKGGEFVMQDSLSMGELFALFALYGYFSGPLAQLVQANQAWQSAQIASERLHDILDLPTDNLEGKTPTKLEKGIRLQQVYFRHGFRKFILKDINLFIPAGSFTGIVGASGSGKSTLMQLLLKVYPTQSGKIEWDDVDIEQISTKDLRPKIALVPQEIELYEGNFNTNISLGDATPNESRIREAARLVGLNKLIEQLDQGYATRLGENGMALSGGQKQRLAIARALYVQPEVILLDEASAWLDVSAERAIMQVVRERVPTVVCISHRLKQLQDADCIYVIQDGNCVEAGTHRELIEKQHVYFQLNEKQNAEFV